MRGSIARTPGARPASTSSPAFVSSIDITAIMPRLTLVLVESLSVPDARRLIREVLRSGSVALSRHAEAEVAKDNLTMVDVTNVLRGGVVDPAEFENGSWRYRVRTARIAVVVAFRSETELRVVTAWRVSP
jgi:hypothetical protein